MHLKLKVDTVSCYIFGIFDRLWTGQPGQQRAPILADIGWPKKLEITKMPALPVRLPDIVVIGGTVSLFAPFQFP